MKKQFLIGLLVLSALSANAQDKSVKSFNYTEFGIYRTVNDTYNVASLRTMFGAFLNPKTTIAVGIGLDGYQREGFAINTAPVFIDGRYYFKNKDVNTFFGTANMGYAVKLSSNFATGFEFGLGAGYRFKISKHNKLNTALRYNYMGLTNVNNFSLQTLGVNLGIYL